MSTRRGLGVTSDYISKAYAKGNRALDEQRKAKDDAPKDNRPVVKSAMDEGLKAKDDAPKDSKPPLKSPVSGGFAGFTTGFLSKGSGTNTKGKGGNAKAGGKKSEEAKGSRDAPPTGAVASSSKPSPPISSRTPPTRASTKPDKLDDAETPRVPFIKSGGGDTGDKLRFKEVEEAMKDPAASFLKEREKEWMTDELLEQVAKDPVLGKMMTDPRFGQVLTEFQKCPRETLEKYGQDGPMGEFLSRFCGLMGTHFGVMGEKEDGKMNQKSKPATKPESTVALRETKPAAKGGVMDEAKFYAAVNDKQVKAVFQMPAVQQLFVAMQTNPQEAQRQLQTNTDPRFKRAVALLVSKGIFRFE